MRHAPPLIVPLLLAAACATSPARLRRAASAVVVIEGARPDGFEALGAVQALACQRDVYAGGPDMQAAWEQLKIEAARLGANALAGVICRQEGTNLSGNCWRAIRCVGDAGRLRYDAPPPGAGNLGLI
jgi:hypothetical protein